MGDAKREIWVVDDEDGSHTWFALEREAREAASANGGAVTRFVPAESPQPKAQEGWTHVSDELPDSDIVVLCIPEDEQDTDNCELLMLEFTDDSEGHGKPYWTTVRGEDLPLESHPFWRPLPAPPEATR